MAIQQPPLEEQLRRAIQASGLSLNQLAQQTGIDSGRLSRFMRGERDLTLAAATKVCDALGLRLAKADATPRAPKGRVGKAAAGRKGKG